MPPPMTPRGRAAPRRCTLLAAASSVLVAAAALLGALPAARAQSQGAALEKIRQQLSPQGWVGIDPNKDICAYPGDTNPGIICDGSTVVELLLPGKDLRGTIPNDPAIWKDLYGVRRVDLSNNPGLVGGVPDVMSGMPALQSINVANTGINGNVPPSLEGRVSGMPGAPSPAPQPSPSPAASPPPAELVAAPPPPPASPSPAAAPPPPEPSPAAAPSPASAEPAAAGAAAQPGGAPANASANATSAANALDAPSKDATSAPPAPAPAAAAAAKAGATEPAAPEVRVTARELPPPPPSPASQISGAPICACALQGVASRDCLKALDTRCNEKGAPQDVKDACATVSKATADKAAAATLAGFLADECFPGQKMGAPACLCYQDPNSNDCAKAKLSLCISQDPLCVPFQLGSDPDAVAAYGKASCPVATPDKDGVQVNLTFPGVALTQWSAQLTNNIGNALAASADVPASSVSLLDVRPAPAPPGASGGASGRRRAARRRLLQANSTGGGGTGGGATGGGGAAAAPVVGRGVQAAYFVESPQPDAVSARLQAASASGTLSKSLASYGVPYQPSVVLRPVYASPKQEGGFPLWALAPIIIGALLLLTALVLAALMLRKRRARGAAGGKDAAGASAASAPAGTLRSSHDAARGAAAPAELPVSKSVRVAQAPAGSEASAAASSQAARAGAPAGGGASSSGSAPRPPSGGGWGGKGAAAGGAAAGGGAVAAAAAAASAASGVPSMQTSGKGPQQAERAKFWAQFQETWQQVRETKRLDDDADPGTPSSGTNWTEGTGQK